MTLFKPVIVGRAVLVGLVTVGLGAPAVLASSEKSNNHAPTIGVAKSATVATIGTSDNSAPAKKGDHRKDGGSEVHWTYEGEQGPANWGNLSDAFRLCADGSMQSPINFGDTFAAGGANIAFDYKVTPVNILHNGHTVQINYEPGSGIAVDGKRYELLQLHFHTPSEHAVDAEQRAMEMHLVHKNAAGELAVIGVLMNIGRSNAALSELWARMPSSASAVQTISNVLVNARDLLPPTHTYYRYMGSLTTPPCTEGVNWFVLDTAVTVGIEQVKRFTDSVGFNARPLQPKSQRLVIAPIQSN